MTARLASLARRKRLSRLGVVVSSRRPRHALDFQRADLVHALRPVDPSRGALSFPSQAQAQACPCLLHSPIELIDLFSYPGPVHSYMITS
jgi:hypothetical protein